MSTETEAAFDEAVERMARAMYDPNRYPPIETCSDLATAALRALLSDSVPCETCSEVLCPECGGTPIRVWQEEAGTYASAICPVCNGRRFVVQHCGNPDCTGGQVSRPSLAVLRADLEQVTSIELGNGTLVEIMPLYRIASGEVAP